MTRNNQADPQIQKMGKNLKEILAALGENPEREGLLETPNRAAQALKYLTQGYKQSLDDIVRNAMFETVNDEMVILQDIELYSLCEHHMLPFFGRAHIGYLPNGRVIGVSKLARIVDFYARRLQIQEQLTQQIAEAIQNMTNARGVGVIIEARHLCMMMRGVQKQNSAMKTSMMLGLFRKNAATRAEFLSAISAPRQL